MAVTNLDQMRGAREYLDFLPCVVCEYSNTTLVAVFEPEHADTAWGAYFAFKRARYGINRLEESGGECRLTIGSTL